MRTVTSVSPRSSFSSSVTVTSLFTPVNVPLPSWLSVLVFSTSTVNVAPPAPSSSVALASVISSRGSSSWVSVWSSTLTALSKTVALALTTSPLEAFVRGASTSGASPASFGSCSTTVCWPGVVPVAFSVSFDPSVTVLNCTKSSTSFCPVTSVPSVSTRKSPCGSITSVTRSLLSPTVSTSVDRMFSTVMFPSLLSAWLRNSTFPLIACSISILAVSVTVPFWPSSNPKAEPFRTGIALPGPDPPTFGLWIITSTSCVLVISDPKSMVVSVSLPLRTPEKPSAGPTSLGAGPTSELFARVWSCTTILYWASPSACTSLELTVIWPVESSNA